MLNPPDDLDPDILADALERGWTARVHSLTYLLLGFGAHHWAAETDAARYFVTVHDLRLVGAANNSRRHLARAFRAARTLRDQAQLSFVVAALPSRTGDLVKPVGPSYALSVYDWLEDVRPIEDPDGSLTAAVVARLHRASTELPQLDAPRETFTIPHRTALHAALAVVDEPWQTGPYAEAARALLRQHAEELRAALVAYERLTAYARRLDRPWCLTHGEPNGSNLLQAATPAGSDAPSPVPDPTAKRGTTDAVHLVDWDSARWAPPERDLWLLDHQPQCFETYRQLSGGSPPDLVLLELYRLSYDLAETAVYILQFRRPHAADANMAESWQNFRQFLPTRERWPGL